MTNIKNTYEEELTKIFLKLSPEKQEEIISYAAFLCEMEANEKKEHNFTIIKGAKA